MSSFADQTPVRIAGHRFAPEDVAFALAWEVYAPGLGGWTVQVDAEEDGSEAIYVDPPLVYGDGFVVRLNERGAVITWSQGACQAPSLRAAMLTICPLAPESLRAVEQLALAPSHLI